MLVKQPLYYKQKSFLAESTRKLFDYNDPPIRG